MKEQIFLIPLLLAAVSAPAAPRTEPAFSDVTEVVAVEVPVQVVRDGEPVRGLTAADFEVYEGKQKQDITGFEVLDLTAQPPSPSAGGTAASPAVPAAARRHFLLLFDLSFSEPKSLVKARQAARDLLGSLRPADLVGVASYSTTEGLKLGLGFTTDRKQVEAALENLSMPEMFDRSADPLRLMIRSMIPPFGFEPSAQGNIEGKESDAEALGENLATLAVAVERGTYEQKSADVLALTRSFASFAHSLSSIEGRKQVVYLSEGFDSSLLFGSSDQTDLDRMAAAAASGQIWNIDPGLRYGNTRAGNELEKMLEELRRADCVIQAVDVGGLRDGGELAGKGSKGQDSLFLLADGTGGELYRNFNDLSVAMKEVLERTSVTYVLAFQPPDLKRDGAYHKLRVELKKDVPGARLVHRAGFYAPLPFAEQTPLERILAAGRQVISGEQRGTLGAAVLAAPFQVQGNADAYVPVLVEVDGSDLLAGAPAKAPVPAEIYAYALDPAGSVRDYFAQVVGLDVAKVGPALRQSGLKLFGHMDLPPGEYSLRVLVRNGATGESALRVVPLRVPEPAGPVLLPPFFPEPQGKWLVVRETLQPGDRQVPYPFMIGEEPYIPAALPVLASGEQAQMSLVAYNLKPGDLRIRSQVLSADGQEIGPAEIQVSGQEPGTPYRLIATFRPPRLEPGEYLVRVSLSGDRGALGTSTTPFVIKPNG